MAVAATPEHLYAATADGKIIQRNLLDGEADDVVLARLADQPRGIASDGIHVYVADSQVHVIRKIVITTGRVTILGGTAGAPGRNDGVGAQARFNEPAGLSTDGRYLYVADMGNHTLRKIDLSSGEVRTLAGARGVAGSADGTGSAARFAAPAGITTDGRNLYIADSGNGLIRKLQ